MNDEKNTKFPEEEKDNKSQTGLLIELLNKVELFYDEQSHIYATFIVGDHEETWSTSSKLFGDYICNQYYLRYKKVPTQNAIHDALSVVRGKLVSQKKRCSVFLRVGSHKDKIYVSLANDQHQFVELSAKEWNVVDRAPIKFRSTANISALPIPLKGGSVEELWKFINVCLDDRILVLAWLLECLRVNTAYPVLVLSGLQGSAKSTTQEVLKMLIDPSSANLRGAPKKQEDLLVAACNNYLVSFNNLSHLKSEQQDELCCLSTGGGFATRRLYTTIEEAVNNIKRPVIMNGISDIVTAQDLIDRTIILELPQISESNRKTDSEFFLEFKAEASYILGALYDLLVDVLNEIPNVQLSEKPRLADFAILGVALERALHLPEGAFLTAYMQNQKSSVLSAMEHSSIALAVEKLISDRFYFDGTYAELFKTLSERYRFDNAGWPSSAKGLATIIKRQLKAFELLDIEITFDKTRKKDGFHLHIKKRLDIDVQQVHQVHRPIIDASIGDEHAVKLDEVTDSHTSTQALESPLIPRTGVQGVHDEL